MPGLRCVPIAAALKSCKQHTNLNITLTDFFSRSSLETLSYQIQVFQETFLNVFKTCFRTRYLIGWLHGLDKSTLLYQNKGAEQSVEQMVDGHYSNIQSGIEPIQRRVS